MLLAVVRLAGRSASAVPMVVEREAMKVEAAAAWAACWVAEVVPEVTVVCIVAEVAAVTPVARMEAVARAAVAKVRS